MLKVGMRCDSSGADRSSSRTQRPLMSASQRGWRMSSTGRIVLFIAAMGMLATVAAPTASAHDRRGPEVTPLASLGNGTFTTGSTIGPDGALYVPEGSAGSVMRVDRRTGGVTT